MTTATPAVADGARRIGRIVFDATAGAVRDLVWPDLRDGVIRVRDLRPAHTALVVLASALFVGGIGVLLASDVVRSSFDLVPASRGTIGRGSLVPEPLVPVTLLVLAFSSGLVLAGALHVARWARVAILLAYGTFALAAQFTAFSNGLTDSPRSMLSFASVVAVVSVFVLRWRAEPRPVAEALVMIGCTTANLALVQWELVRLDRAAGETFLVDQTASLIFLLSGLATPLLLVAGLDVIEFGATASGWVLRFADDRLHRRVLLGGLASLVLWRTRDLVADVSGALADDVGAALRSHLGAGLLVVLVGAAWWVVDRLADRAEGDETEDGDVTGAARVAGLPLALGYQLVSLVLLFVVLGVQVIGRFDSGARADLFDDAYRFVSSVNDGPVLRLWRWGVDAAIIALGLVLARRARRSIALVLVVIGAVDLLAQATATGNWLASLRWDDAAVDHVWFATFALAAVVWATGRRLSDARAQRLAFVVLLGALIRQSDFISDPFALFLSFAGAGFVAFGLLWGFLTAGSWANEATPRFPRSSRVYVFLGYSLFSITLLDWFVLAHDVDQMQSITDRYPTFGQYLLGFPMLYAIFAVTLAGAVKERDLETGDSA